MEPLLFGNYSGVALSLGMGAALLLLVDLWTKQTHKAVVGFQILLITSILPWLQNYQWIVQTRGGWGLPKTPHKDVGLMLFEWVSPIAVYFLLATALWLATRSGKDMYIAAGLPAAIFLMTWYIALPLLQKDAPGQPYLADNIPQFWLFVESAIATLILVAYVAWARLLKHPTQAQ